MTTDDDIREIEESLDEFQDASERVYEAGHSLLAGEAIRLQKEARATLLALIRQKLEAAQKPATSAQPAADVAQNDDEWLRAPLTEREKASTELAGKVVVPWTDDAEHERAVEAWRKRATTGHLVGNSFYHVVGKDEIDEALRLMRARPAKGAP